jgi:hypothetical protein
MKAFARSLAYMRVENSSWRGGRPSREFGLVYKMNYSNVIPVTQEDHSSAQAKS